jgi:uncharacterized damage-inducible protein DinB
MPSTLSRPASDEYAPYYDTYIRNIPDPDVVPLLADQMRDTAASIRSFSDSTASRTNEPGKWSVKEILGHLIDCERIFAYRALRFGRNDLTPLPGFDQDPYMEAAAFNVRPLADLVSEYELVRQSTLALCRSLSSEACTRRGLADGKSITVRALFWAIAAHERHHMKILRSRYM